jgi:hypothetical protein
LRCAPDTWPDRVDHDHDHQAEAEGDAEVSERACLGVDHDRAAPREDERERADELGGEPTGGRQTLSGSRSATSFCTR